MRRLKVIGVDVFLEKRKTRLHVGVLNRIDGKLVFTYDKHYFDAKNIIPLGPEFPLTQQVHRSQEGKLFPSLLDRIPSKDNPAYAEYCQAFGLKADEANIILLLTTIGKRGPSTFIFESVCRFKTEDLIKELKSFRNQLGISLWEFSTAFDVPYLTMQRIENGKSKDMLTMRLVALMVSCPEAAQWQLKLSGSRVRREMLHKLVGM